MNETKQCPICSKTIPLVPRYPHYVCQECASRATSADGRPLKFYNETPLGGGILAFYADTKEPYHPGHSNIPCWIDGISCIAAEARFGGIVIQVLVEGAWQGGSEAPSSPG